MILPSRRWYESRWLIALLAGSLAVRLGWALSRPIGLPTLGALPDQLEYLALAKNVLKMGNLCFYDPRFGQTVWAYRMPGYPLFIAACRANLPVVRAVQALVDTSTVLAVYLLARRVLPLTLKQGPIWSAAIVACNPYLIYFTGMILSETLFTAMIAWGMALLSVPNESARPRPLASRSGQWGLMLLVLSVLVRPDALLLPSLLAIAAVAVNNRRFLAYDHRLRRPLAMAAGMLSLFLAAIAILAWGYRNFRLVGEPVWFTTNGGITLYDGNHPGADGSSDQAFLAGMPQLKSMSETARNAYLTAAAEHFIAQHPRADLALAINRLARTWSPIPLSQSFGTRFHQAIALAYSVPWDGLVLLGLISARVSRPAKVFLLMPAIYLTAVHLATVGSVRYRIPAEPPMAIMAAAMLSSKAREGPATVSPASPPIT